MNGPRKIGLTSKKIFDFQPISMHYMLIRTETRRRLVGKSLLVAMFAASAFALAGCATPGNANTLKGVPPLYWYTTGPDGVTWVPLLGSCQYRQKDGTFTIGFFTIATIGSEKRTYDETGKYASMKGWDVNLLGLWSSFEEEIVGKNYTIAWYEKLFLFGFAGYGNLALGDKSITYLKLFWFLRLPSPEGYLTMEYACPVCGTTVDDQAKNCPVCAQEFLEFAKE
jgi:hypothetical protein